jgi:protein pelota
MRATETISSREHSQTGGVALKVLKRILKEGKIKLKIETLDDLWHLYNVVGPGDQVISRTMRRVRVGDESGRKQESVRKPMTLLGTVLEGPNDLVNIGSHHTINVEPGRTLTIIKEHWPGYLLTRLKQAEKTQGTPVCLIVTIEDGMAELFLAADFGLSNGVRVRTTISRKRGDQKSHDKTMKEFFTSVTLAVRSQIEQNDIGLIVIAGPGFVKDHFKTHLMSAGVKDLPSVVAESSNSIGIPGAKEILFRGIIGKAIKGLKLEAETQLVEKLIEHLAKDNGLAAYGDDEVKKAVQFGAVETLLITDKKLREGTDEQRRKMDRLIRDVEKIRAEFHIVSTDHPAGNQLQNLSGIAATLRFRIDK